MITIVLTNRNRDLQIVKKCLDTLQKQSNQDFELFFVDYGSINAYLLDLQELIKNYSKLKFIGCPVSGQLWNKSRAINIALKKCETDYFFVGDIDMLFHDEFVNKLYSLKKENEVTYFQVGFLNKEESSLDKDFLDLNPAFLSSEGATGMTLYPAKLLKEINGYDEFYNGWGAEDTDVHVRLRNLGISVLFYEKELLLKHQWHPKTYRTLKSVEAYHFDLEKINHSYIKLTQKTKLIKVNENHNWGVLPDQLLYLKLKEKADFDFNILPELKELIPLISQFNNFEQKVIAVTVTNVTVREKSRELAKRLAGKKYREFLTIDAVNDIILQEILIHYRNAPYEYSFDRKNGIISLKMYLSK